MEMKPIIPFEPVSTENIPRGDQWIAQIKWDGVRVLTYFDGRETRLFNRKLNERTRHYPELVAIDSYCSAQSVILDGEVIALGRDGKPSFHEVMRRDGIRRMERVKQAQKFVPVTYMVFDVIFNNGRWIHHLPLRERLEILSDIVMPGDHIQLVSSHHDAETLYDVIEQQGMEGIVLKDLDSKYVIGGKNNRWQKKKNYRDLIAVVGGVTLRAGVVNAVLLGLYNEIGELWYIGHAGTGKLTREDWRNFTTLIKPLITDERPFANRPGRLNDAIWLKPFVTAKIKFMDWTGDGSIRQPSIQAFVDVLPQECRF